MNIEGDIRAALQIAQVQTAAAQLAMAIRNRKEALWCQSKSQYCEQTTLLRGCERSIPASNGDGEPQRSPLVSIKITILRANNIARMGMSRVSVMIRKIGVKCPSCGHVTEEEDSCEEGFEFFSYYTIKCEKCKRELEFGISDGPFDEEAAFDGRKAGKKASINHGVKGQETAKLSQF